MIDWMLSASKTMPRRSSGATTTIVWSLGMRFAILAGPQARRPAAAARPGWRQVPPRPPSEWAPPEISVPPLSLLGLAGIVWSASGGHASDRAWTHPPRVAGGETERPHTLPSRVCVS